MRVCVERYGFLPVDKSAFKGEIPAIANMVPFAPFDFYIKRKLYVHNMGHATCAYLGDLLGLKYIYQSIAVPQIRILVQNAMLESAMALSSMALTCSICKCILPICWVDSPMLRWVIPASGSVVTPRGN